VHVNGTAQGADVRVTARGPRPSRFGIGGDVARMGDHSGPPDDAWSRGTILTRLGRTPVIILGVILLVLGFLLSIPVLWTLGIILLVIGAILAVLGSTGRAVGGRNHWY
jgi:Family of unknown function (DUF6131)